MTIDAERKARTTPGRRWHDTVPAVELDVVCGTANHRLRWARGSIEMLDHPDPDAEAALVALGGDEPTCLQLVGLWQLALADGGFLEEWVDDAHLTPTRLSWLSMALERLRNEGFHEFLRALPPARAEPMGRFLHRFPRPWLDRAAGAVAESVVDGPGVECDQAEPLISAAVAQRVRRAFVAGVGAGDLSLGAAALVPLRVDVTAGPNRDQPAAAATGVSLGPAAAVGSRAPEPTIAGRLQGPGRAVSISVDRGWLHRAWAAGAAVVDDHLVLDLASSGAPESGVDASIVVWNDARPRIVRAVVAYDGTSWSIV